MSDYHFETCVSRSQFANQLAANEEQLLFVLTNALSQVAADDLIDVGEMGDEADPELVIGNLRKIADAIAAGDVY